MGIFGSLFGRSDRKEEEAGDRCNDCGMAGGAHTDWCPTAAASEEEAGPRVQEPRTGSGDEPPTRA